MAPTVEGLDQRLATVERAQGETTETLRWVVTKLARIQAVQDEHTLRLDRLESKVDSLGSKVGSLESKVDSLESKTDALPRAIAEMIDASEKRVVAAVAGRR
jgi:chromosome segregation ATPase